MSDDESYAGESAGGESYEYVEGSADEGGAEAAAGGSTPALVERLYALSAGASGGGSAVVITGEGVTSFDASELAAKMEARIRSVAEMLCISPDEAFVFLQALRWQTDRVQER